MTALIGLEKYGCIAEEDMVLVNVGIGGIGLAAVDIAANIFRAKVIIFSLKLFCIFNIFETPMLHSILTQSNGQSIT